jgi:hypothetical protein
MHDALIRAGLQGQDSAGNWATTVPAGFILSPGCWSSENTVIFSADSGSDAQNLWETGISLTTGKVNGTFKRVTAGSGNDSDASCAPGGAVVFSSTQVRRDIWSFDLDRGKSKGAPERRTESPARRSYPSLSGDGRYVAFASAQSGRYNIWLRELETGKESPVASSSLVQRFPVISASGNKVAFSTNENDKRFVYMSTPGGFPEKLCEGCIRATDWSRDDRALLVFLGNPFQVNALDVASHQLTVMLKHPKYSLVNARFSPDNRWVSFTARIEPNGGWIMIAPIGGPKPVPENEWSKIAEGGAEDRAYWSPDGKTLYFSSTRDGHHCLWGQKDRRAVAPAGGRGVCGAASAGAGGLRAGGGLVGGGRENRNGAQRGNGQHLDDVALGGALNRLGAAIMTSMYNPMPLVETRIEVLHAFIRSHPLGTLVTNGPDGHDASHVPLFLDAAAGLLRCHMARANLQWQQLSAVSECS